MAYLTQATKKNSGRNSVYKKKTWPTSTISEPATVVIIFWIFLIFHHILLSTQVKQSLNVSNKNACKSVAFRLVEPLL